VTRAVLDSSALLAYFLAEPGAEAVKQYLGHSTISAVNLSEVVARLANRGAVEELIREQFQKLKLSISNFDEEIGYATGMLRERTKVLGLSLGDRACIATAVRLNLPAVTADRLWAELDLGVEIVVIRGSEAG
jgi:PIN domain nuclease of toxin-antitoxin system